ncbi:MAG: C39 family peptidase, partial [Clostridia bacterium]|nr:C39 family peptidase [Clostridia bacterium]
MKSGKKAALIFCLTAAAILLFFGCLLCRAEEPVVTLAPGADPDGSGVIDEADVILLIRCLADPGAAGSSVTTERGDVNGDGVIDTADVIRLKNYLADRLYRHPPAACTVQDVPLVWQNDPEDYWPTGCESVSAVMLLRHAGYDVTTAEFVSHLATSPGSPAAVGNTLYAPDPRDAFVGTPDDPGSFGCMLPVIRNALTEVLAEKGVERPESRIIDASGLTLDELARRNLLFGRPVAVWTGMEMKLPAYRFSWVTPAGTTYNWPSNEHCQVLVGYDETCYYFNDPATGLVRGFEKATAEESYAAYGK